MKFDDIYTIYRDQIIETKEEVKPGVQQETEVKETPSEELISDEILASKWLGVEYKELSAQEKIDYKELYNQFKAMHNDPERALRGLENEWGSLRLGDTRVGRIKRYLKLKGIINNAYSELQDI